MAKDYRGNRVTEPNRPDVKGKKDRKEFRKDLKDKKIYKTALGRGY